MQEIELGVQFALDPPEGATTATVTYEWGQDVEQGEGSFTPDSVGIYKVTWDTGQRQFYSAYVPVITLDEFNGTSGTYTEDEFSTLERQMRFIIQNYTGQKFGPVYNKTLSVQGDGGQSLVLPIRCERLEEIVTNFGDSILDLVEVNIANPAILQKKHNWNSGVYRDIKKDITVDEFDIFSEAYTFSIDGDFGWEYVPGEVQEAGRLLITSLIEDDDIGAMRQRGINAVQLGDFSAKMSMDQWGSTGNATADNLLAEYVDFYVGVV